MTDLQGTRVLEIQRLWHGEFIVLPLGAPFVAVGGVREVLEGRSAGWFLVLLAGVLAWWSSRVVLIIGRTGDKLFIVHRAWQQWKTIIALPAEVAVMPAKLGISARGQIKVPADCNMVLGWGYYGVAVVRPPTGPPYAIRLRKPARFASDLRATTVNRDASEGGARRT